MTSRDFVRFIVHHRDCIKHAMHKEHFFLARGTWKEISRKEVFQATNYDKYAERLDNLLPHLTS